MMRVDVIVPVKSGAAHLPGCVEAIRAQTLAAGRIHISVAPSGDATLDAAHRLAAHEPRIVVHENPAGDRGSGINVALSALDPSTDAVAMVDAQSRLERDYLERAVAVLEQSGAGVVGGHMRPVGQGVFRQAIAAALTSRAGVGNSSFHFEGVARDAESVYLGVYRRSVLDEIGGYDPTLIRTEDDDMNARIRAAGYRIRLDPTIRSAYIPRESLAALFRQYRGYGHSKVSLARSRPDAIRPRHLAPAALVAAFAVASLTSVSWWRPALTVLTAAYGSALAAAALRAPRLPARARAAMVAALAAMHWGYGLGTWQAILRSPR